MHYGIALTIVRGECHTSNSFKNIISLKSPLRLQTSITARFGKWATTHVGTILILIPSAFREEVIIDFRLARLASDCKLSPLALKKALFISQKAKHASLLWGMLVICRFPGLMMPFHHQTAKNISSKKENQQAKLRIRSLDLLASSLGHVVERIRFRANAVISESQLGFQLKVNVIILLLKCSSCLSHGILKTK